VTGVVDNSHLATAFICTNTLSSAVTLGVEVFGPAGGASLNDASARLVVVPAGGTAVLVTSPMAAFSGDAGLDLAGQVAKGAARILTTTSFRASQSVLCTAILANPGTVPPTVMATLPVTRR
jgi:hypothetical protein